MTRIRPYRGALRSIRALRFEDLVRLVKAQAALLRARVDVRRRPQGELVSGANSPEGQGPPSPSRRGDAELVGEAIRRAAKFGLFRPTCLVRSIAISAMLRKEGITGGRIRVGVGLRDGKFVAHAWVEYDGVIIGDDDSVVSRFDAIDDLRVVAPH
jgi:hypothetical protein